MRLRKHCVLGSLVPVAGCRSPVARSCATTTETRSTRIVLVGPVAPPAGGIATHVAALSAALSRRGVRNLVVDPARSRAELAVALAWAAGARARVHVHACGHNAKSYLLVAACATSAATRPIVSLHSGRAPAYLSGCRRAARVAIARLLSGSCAIACASPAIADALVDVGVPGSKVHVVTPYLRGGLAPGAPPPRTARASRPLVVAAVAPGLEYGADVLVDGFALACEALPAATLAVFGPDRADDQVAAALAARGLAGRVLALGELDHATAMGVLQACDVHVRPTRADGDSIVVREALGLGRRVVASSASARPSGVHVFASGDPAALCRALLAALAGPPPLPASNDGLAALLALYRRVGVVGIELEAETDACAESPVG